MPKKELTSDAAALCGMVARKKLLNKQSLRCVCMVFVVHILQANSLERHTPYRAQAETCPYGITIDK